MRRNILGEIEQNKKDPEKVRLILLTANLAFNEAVDYIRQQRDDKAKKEHIDKLSEVLRLPKTFIYMYAKIRKPFLKDIEAQQGIYYVYDTAMGPKNIIDKDGIFIKFDPDKSNDYYKKLIKQLRSTFAFLQASEDEKEKFLKSGGHSSLHFLDNKKAKKRRHQHGFNFEQDINIYLECEESFKKVFTTTTGIKDEGKILIKHAIEFATENLGLDYCNAGEINRIKRIYYEVCRRYKLPTPNNFFPFN